MSISLPTGNATATNVGTVIIWVLVLFIVSSGFVPLLLPSDNAKVYVVPVCALIVLRRLPEELVEASPLFTAQVPFVVPTEVNLTTNEAFAATVAWGVKEEPS